MPNCNVAGILSLRYNPSLGVQKICTVAAVYLFPINVAAVTLGGYELCVLCIYVVGSMLEKLWRCMSMEDSTVAITINNLFMEEPLDRRG